MKHLMLAVPILSLMATVGSAQTDTTGTDTTAGGTATGEMFGTNWPLSVGTTFFTDGDSSTVRSAEELTTGWQSLSQEDRDMIKADCATFMSTHGDAAATTDGAAAGATVETDAGTETDAATSDTSAEAATEGTAGAETSGTEGTTTAPAGYDMAEMKAICAAVETL